jgi:hypothetical protein
VHFVHNTQVCRNILGRALGRYTKLQTHTYRDLVNQGACAQFSSRGRLILDLSLGRIGNCDQADPQRSLASFQPSAFGASSPSDTLYRAPGSAFPAAARSVCRSRARISDHGAACWFRRLRRFCWGESADDGLGHEFFRKLMGAKVISAPQSGGVQPVGLVVRVNHHV